MRSGQLVAVEVALSWFRLRWPAGAASVYSVPGAKRWFVCSEMPMIESNHDVSDPADFLMPRKLTGEFCKLEEFLTPPRVAGPEEIPIAHTSAPFLLIMRNAGQLHMKHKKSEETMIMTVKATRLFLTAQSAAMKPLYGLT